jgi:hypothetical protein
MKIINFQTDGFRKLKAVNIEFSPNGITRIKGGNEQGKTSILDAIEYTLKGKSTISNHAIQRGKNKLNTELETDEFIVKRVKTDKSERLEISRKDGTKINKSKQAFLNQLFNELTFSPFPFINKTADQKMKFIIDLMGEDFSKYDEKEKKFAEERLLIGRQIKKENIGEEPEKVEPVEIKELYEAKAEIENFNRIQEEHGTKRESLKQKAQQIKEEIERLKAEYNSIVKEHNEVPAPLEIKDTKQIQEKINNAAVINAKAAQYDKWLERKKHLDELQGEYNTYNNKVKQVRELKIKKLQEINTGVPGLEVREDGLYYNDVFSEEWSDSQAIKIACQLCQKQSPEIKAVFVDRGETFDNKQLYALQQWAEDNDIQCIITQVGEPTGEEDEYTYYIEEGEIK